jgi:VanZ family protein
MLWILCAAYWITLFTLTHLPRVPVAVAGRLSDKAMHFLAYAVLAGLLYIAMCASRSLWKRPAFLVIAVTLLYGAMDELTQPLVGRSCEFLDWVADAAGALSVVGLFAFVRYRAENGRRKRADRPMSVAVQEGT